MTQLPVQSAPLTPAQAQAILERRAAQRAATAKRELARRHLIDFAAYVKPAYARARHLDYIAGWLERVRRRDVKRLMIFAPPRHGKSKLTSEMFPAWALGCDPTEQFMICSAAQHLSRHIQPQRAKPDWV